MFRKSGSVASFFLESRIPSGEELTQALARHRFRTIENAASEETSIGWVTAGDPTGDSFELEDLDLDVGLWLRVRIDSKKLPTAWMRIHRAVAERSAGRKLSARERRDLKADLSEQLLPRVLPSVQFVDALYVPKSSRVLLFATSARLVEEFEKLFFRTFATPLERATPHTLAERGGGLDREALAYLEEVAPVRWPRDGATEPARRIADVEEPAPPVDEVEIES